jgi:RNA polymerase sigma-70 factor (ECF subfamily)
MAGSGMRQDASLLADPAFVDDLRRQMVRFAGAQLADLHMAEDAVQEALVGALKNAGSFAGRAAFKTWVFAILKNKIADALRQRQRLAEHVALPALDDEDDVIEEVFDRRGMWKQTERPADWGNPEAEMLDRDFWRVFEACLEHLPAQQGRLFMMREFVDMDTSEICSEAGISINNLNVILHRARLRLRSCLEIHWFTKGARP